MTVETYAEPVDDVAVGWVAGAAGELFFAGGVDGDGVFESAFVKGEVSTEPNVFQDRRGDIASRSTLKARG